MLKTIAGSEITPDEPIDEEVTPLPENDRILAERGLQFQTYQRPGWFQRTFNPDSAAQVESLNADARYNKNAALGQLAGERARGLLAEQEAADRAALEGTRFANDKTLKEIAHENSLKEGNAGVLNKNNMIWTPGQQDTFNASTFEPTMNKVSRTLAADAAEAQSRGEKATLFNQWLAANRDAIMARFDAENAKPSLDNLSAEQALVFGQQLQPSKVSEAEFEVTQQPTRRLIAEEAGRAARLANDKSAAMGNVTVLPAQSVIAGDASGIPLTAVTGGHEEEYERPFEYVNPKTGEVVKTGMMMPAKRRVPPGMQQIQRPQSNKVVPW